MNWRVKILDIARKTSQEKQYNANIKFQYEGTEESIQRDMDNSFWDIFNHHLKYNKNYRRFLEKKGFDFDNKNLKQTDIPIITKNDLKEFYPIVSEYKHSFCHTGGSTSEPFKYPLSKESASALWANLWTAFAVCDVKPCEKMLLLSWHANRGKGLKKTIYHKVANMYSMSAFETSESQLKDLYDFMVKENIKSIYGYMSSIVVFLQYMQKYDLYLDLKGIFTTSENIFPIVHVLAQKYCNCHAIDIFGAHDGGLSAFECKEHCGYHIMHNRTVVEIIDNKIVVTDTLNKSFPFIRYNLGDLAKSDQLFTEKCKCGRTLFRIDKFIGRESQVFTDNNGNRVTMFLFACVLDEDSSIIRYQIKKYEHKVVINIISDEHDATYYANKHIPELSAKINFPMEIEMNTDLIALKNEKIPLFVEL